MNKKYHVKLNDREKEYVYQVMNQDKTCKSVKKRCTILLLADETVGKPPTQEEIAQRCGVSDVTAYQTIKDYSNQGIEYTLRSQKPAQLPRKPIITGEIEARIIALACSEPPKGFSRWTIRLLARKAVELEIIEAVGREAIRTTLKKHNLSLT
ncbi:MAG TPA: helix-turn-helix domain-containing protein [Methylomusa anaerophila]|uniref:Transposase n=1 Tax=Methylomusa anaerophila TaxID=1930071 RepID=A0A348AID1_9FIRM|nr:helix-turn-helix domain-containing protein [Methylomusa anaerophila]BBB90829.1 hypothetical protein MAMMFC1_01491 [Methylomusa anaerophila]HML90620.1 helix-turn-helix domain-containing protein [Methylomusa anaerophila]